MDQKYFDGIDLKFKFDGDLTMWLADKNFEKI